MKIKQLPHAGNFYAATPHDGLRVDFVQDHHIGGDDGAAQNFDGFLERVGNVSGGQKLAF